MTVAEFGRLLAEVWRAEVGSEPFPELEAPAADRRVA